jgi:hypothetical protein
LNRLGGQQGQRARRGHAGGVVGEGNHERRSTFQQRGKGATRADGGELAMVANEDKLRLGPLDGEGEAGEVVVIGHGGLVELCGHRHKSTHGGIHSTGVALVSGSPWS